jgi:DNA-binding SARP family transcriptional activator/tetratricopeptide (TPR) repeat protein
MTTLILELGPLISVFRFYRRLSLTVDGVPVSIRGDMGDAAIGVRLDFAVLGPLQVRSGQRRVAVAGERQQLILAALLLKANRTVGTADLAAILWDEDPPATARDQVHNAVWQIRRGLARHGAAELLRSEPGGYRMCVDAQRLDLLRFELLVTEGRLLASAKETVKAAGVLRHALSLWRGPALAGLTSNTLQRQVVRLEELRLAVLEEWVEHELACGQHDGLPARLAALVEEHPLRERLAAAHMLALYRTGRQAEALAVYRRVASALSDELGVDPAPELTSRFQAILRGDPGLNAPPHPGASAPAAERPAELPAAAAVRPAQLPAAAVRPAQLPAAAAVFVGRGEHLRELDALLADPVHPGPAAVVIAVIAGAAGVGKTALAVQWAHRVGDRFPDGQLYVNLRGYDPEEPMTAGDALAGFLGALGVAGRDIPLELDARAARYRTEVAGRRLLIVLDNASTVEQVRPLLPGTASCAVVVTSRDSLAGLVAVHGAHRIDLDVLPAADAIALLRRLVGPRVDAESVAAAALVDQCARLPLALRAAAERVVFRRTDPLADLVADLAVQERRLAFLDADGDPRGAVAAVFSWSIRHLPPEAVRTFHLIGLHPGPDLDAFAAAALADVALEQASRTLDLLERAHLVHATCPGRYGMHDLLRAYAVGLPTAESGADGTRAPLGRLFDYYLATTAAAMDRLHPAEAHRRPRIPRPATPAPAMADMHAARRWLDAELHCLVAVAAHAAGHGWPAHTIRLASTLVRYLDSGHHTDALAIHTHARRAAEQSGDHAAHAQALLDLGTAHWRLAHHGRAAEHHQQALVLFRRLGNREGEAWALNGLGEAAHAAGHTTDALTHHTTALTIATEIGARDQQARAHTGLGRAHHALADPDRAREHYERGLAIYTKLGSPDTDQVRTNLAALTQPPRSPGAA